MKAIARAVLMCVMAVPLISQAMLAQDQQTKPAPLEAFFCKFQPGKGMADLLPVAQRFAKWADQQDTSYSAWILTPAFGQFTELPQVVWLGSNPSGNEMGKGQEAWRKSGGELQKAFDSVIACGMHSVASSVEINAPEGSPGDGVVMFTQCSVDDDGDYMQAVAAHKQYAKAMRALGAKGSNWLFFPMIGGPAERDFDYYGVSTFPSWSDFFAAYELYVNGGGWQKGMELFQDVTDCREGSPSVWDVKLVRRAAP
ncbi:MAG: hypothetical protein KDI05_03940 [Halieaceae bacterium]|nr:hypothetical protein [Halieaceae bacterium]